MHVEKGSVYIETSHIILKNNLNPETLVLQENSQDTCVSKTEPPQFSAASSEFPDTWLSGCFHLLEAEQSWGILKESDETH